MTGSGSFEDLDRYVELPRLDGLAVSPDGSRLVTSVSTPAPDGKRFRSALWELDPTGERPPRRVTRSAPGESSPTFLPSGDLLFTSTRPDPDAEPSDRDDDRARLWLLPADGGEARLIADPPAGIGGVVVARDADVILLSVEAHPSAGTWQEDREWGDAREEDGASGHLYTSYPVRYWDRWLGPREPRLWVAELPDGEGRITDPTLITPHAGMALLNAGSDISPDGGTVVTSWRRTSQPHPDQPFDLVAIDVATGEHRVLVDDGWWYGDFGGIAFGPDGRHVAVVRGHPGAPDRPSEVDLAVIDVQSGDLEVLTGDFEFWPGDPAWTPDGRHIVFHADARGHGPLFRVDVDSREIVRVTSDGFHTGHVIQVEDATHVHVVRSSVGLAPHPARYRLDDEEAQGEEITSPAEDLVGPGRVERVVAEADDGVEVPSWLVLPDGDGPHPLVVFIHGGPLGSWNAWHWRWNPHVLSEHGYAVLLPDPALSTGYGPEMIARGWGRWEAEPYTDLMAAVEDAASRDDIDADRVAAMGGSFGGYMANWVAGSTDRFRCIVTHASEWDSPQWHATADLGIWAEFEFGSPYEDPSPYERISPGRNVADISTPMLVIHGRDDQRVPIDQALSLWTDLIRHEVEARFLYFPDENHWIAKPPNIRLWYRTVLAFLAEHLDGVPFERPAHL